MAKGNGGGYLDEIQERMDGDVFRAMLEGMARRVMEEELAVCRTSKCEYCHIKLLI